MGYMPTRTPLGVTPYPLKLIDFGKNFINHLITGEEWVNNSTKENKAIHRECFYLNHQEWSFFQRDGGYYGYMWLGYDRTDGNYDFFAHGKYGQV
ncbi:hypothetical protein Amet_4409 [Alkaliphilus metalliredigens QYMF]|uniref:Uncharacterized protein n=1 Tax=Alkaliphilus metalliredigens (strain QYMF) TaxID=293826 RepID=A6TWB4_ALKMQ|nr:hypothetical protein Amet_4409 [Alkaliphilus metalliredigens QYMF]